MTATPRHGVVPFDEGDPAAFAAQNQPGLASILAGTVIGQAATRPAGIALRLDPAQPDGTAFDIVVVDPEGRALLPLGPFPEEDVVAIWRSLGASSGLPLMVLSADGVLRKPYPQIGRVQLGAIRIRRRHGLLNDRRPRFLVRRKTGRLPLRPRVHQEREIAGRDGA